MRERENVPITTVRDFWDSNPLFAGEGAGEPGTRPWFEQHERVLAADCLADERALSFVTQDVRKDACILDVGCGPGFWVRFFLRRGFQRVWACDLTPQAVRLTRTSLDIFGLRTEGTIQEGNAEQLPYEDATFDHVNCQGVIHHTPDTEQCVREFFRVLKPGGTVCFSVYYKNFILRHPALFRTVQRALSSLVGLKGRGREAMLRDAKNAEDMVRLL
ncbi:MAG: class I SAM-dependent methyltransferase [Desulfovibrio sp.]|nr:class I SAM-dependent methyltransferase [Desulfovibrio sp.]